MRIALAQMKNQGSVEANLNQSIEWMREAAEHGADLILFPEVQLTEFFPQYQGQDVRRYRLYCFRKPRTARSAHFNTF